ncbi:MAG: O-antigen ligase family protein [Prevotellaceae bacterium]|nr:O-antigen ligase family protein [Prevotellaceae bacterium]
MLVDTEKASVGVLAFLMVILTGAVYWSAYGFESYAALLAVFGFTVLVCCAFLKGIPRWYLIYVIVTAACYFISAFMNGIGLSEGLNIKTAFQIDIYLLIVLTAYAIDKRRTINYFVNIVVFVSAISLVFYTIQTVLGRESVSSLFSYLNWGRGHYVNLLYTYAANDTRNYSIFYEPGVFQIVTTASLYLLIFAKQYFNMGSKRYGISVVVLIASVLTCGSTTGYLNMLILLIGVLFLRRKSKTQTRLIWLFAAVVIFLVYDYMVNGDASVINTYVIEKMFDISSDSSDVYYQSSGGARYFMFNMAITALKENPFFGIGNTRVSAAIGETFFSGFGTGNGLCAMIASKGLITTIATISPIIYMAYRNRGSAVQFWTFILIYFNTVVAQSTNSLMCCAFVLLAITEYEETAETEEDETVDTVILKTQSWIQE